MKKIFYFLYKNRTFIVFTLLELTSVAFAYTHKSNKHSFIGINNGIIGSIYELISEIKSYPLLKSLNEQLLSENAALCKKLLQAGESSVPLHNFITDTQHDLILAKVINNSIVNTKNYLTLNKGTLHGITPGMGVICKAGVVGKVKAVSERFATVVSLLHTDVLISAKLGQSGAMGTIQWPGQDPFCAQMLYVPRHVTVEPGEAVVTSGYNATFFEGILIGHVKHVALRQGASFYDIILNLSTDFSTLQYVYVVKNILKQEQDTLEQRTKSFYE